MSAEVVVVNGVEVRKGFLDLPAQEAMRDALRGIARDAPFRQYVTPGGARMSARMTGAGERAWLSDRSGYRYDAQQPDGRDWPSIPDCVLDVWWAVSGVERLPDSCLVNFYGEGAKMGTHQDRDEADLTWPVVSISLGDAALFRVGGTVRRAKTECVWLESGDVVVLAGEARLAYHGIDRIRFGSSALLSQGGRINVTLRVAGSNSSP
jgi:alkylated DNA repair protein (DNA oxidative demethylase)